MNSNVGFKWFKDNFEVGNINYNKLTGLRCNIYKMIQVALQSSLLPPTNKQNLCFILESLKSPKTAHCIKIDRIDI